MENKKKYRNDFSIDGSGRRFTENGLKKWREYVLEQMRSRGEYTKANIYEKMSLYHWASNGGYVIVKPKKGN
jgi:hypothetical protein